MELKEAIKQIRTEDKRKFDQSIDLIINLKGLDLRKDNINAIATINHPFKEKKVCGFLTKKSELVKTVTNLDFPKYRDKDALKDLVKEFDFFIASMSLMPAVATTFGKSLGPTGKMPSPQLGVLTKEDDSSIKQLLDKINHSIKIRLKEPSFKISIGKESMKDEYLIENALAIYNTLINVLPTKKENVKSILLKTTMGKPLKVEIK
jgi:large subunit ribosomal protein L1